MQILIPLPPNVQYIHESQWGLTTTEKDKRRMDKQPLQLPRFFYHHQAGNAPDMTLPLWDDDPITWIKEMDRRDVSEGMKAYQYSYAIHQQPSGLVSVIGGRGDRYPGATRGQNPVSKAVCFAGNFDSTYGPNTRRRPSNTEIEAGKWLVQNLVANGILASNFIGLPHSGNPLYPGATACPGDWIVPHIPYMNAPYPVYQPPKGTVKMELVNIQPGRLNNGALFAITGSLIQWITATQWAAMGNPPATRVLSRPEARAFHIIGIVPAGYEGIFANA